ncbi:MAG: hypothetical protein M5R38_15870 [Candidatus Methylomirabilis sp.]|nr:hypothetical protein [Candidatus Methylomirabilis sp.]
MAEMVLPGVYIEVRPEGLIVPGRVTVGNLGVVGTANKGPVGVSVILGSYTEAREQFGNYDSFGTPNEPRRWCARWSWPTTTGQRRSLP